MTSRPLLLALLALASSAALLGCDPQMPGVSGRIALGKGVDSAKFQNLEMRAMVAPADLGAKTPAFPDEVANASPDGEGAGAVWSGDIESTDKGAVFLQRGQPLEGVSFPLPYTLGGDGIGSTDEEHWRLFVWLSADADSHLAKRPAHGEPFGAVDFDANGCGLAGGYCGVKSGVDVTIDSIAP